MTYSILGIYDDHGRNISNAVSNLMDREKVRAALEATFKDCGVQSALVASRHSLDDVSAWHLADMITDRLIEGLTGKGDRLARP